MKARQVVNKIAALTAGLSVVGATIAGASAAADLAQYPSPLFIKDGKFSGFIVVGKSAATEDVLGSIDMAAALQAASVKKSPTATTTSDDSSDSFSVDGGFRIEKQGVALTFGKYIATAQDTALDDTDLPVMLKSGDYTDDEGENDNAVEFDQEIAFASTAGQVQFAQDDDDAPVGAPYLFFDGNANAYTYTLDFNEDVDVDNTTSTTVSADVDDTEISILGQTYTIISSNSDSNGLLNKLTLLAGQTVVWLAKDEPVTRVINGAEHEISLAGVNSGEDKCSLTVDGVTSIVSVGQTKTVNGVEIGVSDAIHSDTGLDNCKVNIGATKLIVESGQEVKLNDEDIDDSTGNVMMTDENSWAGLNITVQPSEDTYLAAGKSWTDPVFGAFKVTFGGLETQVLEHTKVTASGDDAQVTFTNLDGKEVKLDYTLDASNFVIMGDGLGVDDRTYLEGQVCEFTAITDCEGAKFLLITSGGEAHLMEIKSFDTSDNQVDVKDITYDANNNDLTFDETLSTAQTLSLSSGAGAITWTLTNNTGGTGATLNRINFTSIDSSSSGAKTDGESYLSFVAIGDAEGAGNSLGPRIFTFTEDADDNVGGAAFRVNLTYDSGDDEINVVAPVATTGGFQYSSVDTSSTNDDTKWYATNWTTLVAHDAEDQHSLEVWYPKDYRNALIYVSEVGAGLSDASSALGISELQPIQVGSAKLDTEVDDVEAQNLLVVGGPCVNSVAAKLMESGDDCAAGFKEGQAMIKLFEHSNGKVAVLVAGYAAMDTRRASRVLASYKDFAGQLKGKEVVVTGETLSDVKVSAATE